MPSMSGVVSRPLVASPAFDGGTNGLQLLVLTYVIPAMITSRTIASLIATTVALNRADSLTPAMMIMVSRPTSAAAATLWCVPVTHAGRWMPMSSRNEAKYVDQPDATAAAPSASSRIRSQPMIQAMISPSDVYENVYAEPET